MSRFFNDGKYGDKGKFGNIILIDELTDKIKIILIFGLKERFNLVNWTKLLIN